MSWGKGLVLIVFILHFVSIECIVRQFDCLLKFKGAYNGKISVTRSGKKCQRWDSNSPKDHTYKDSHFPLDGSRTAAENYCRNPDNLKYQWCYPASVPAGTTPTYEYCNIPYCTKGTECTITPNGAEYLGTKAVAEVGGVEIKCQRWDSQTPETHTWVNPNGVDFNEVTLKETENYCRHYKQDESGPWCYLTSGTRFKECFTTPPGVPICAENNICDAPPTVADATVLSFSPASAGPKYDHKTTATYKCNSGFEFADPYDGVECLLTKQWTAPPTCNRVKCPTLFVSRSTATLSGPADSFETVVAYTCDKGSKLASGDAYIKCQADKTWNGTAPTCTQIVCGDAPDVSGASVVKTTSTIFGGVASYKCESDGQNYDKTCELDGKWKGDVCKGGTPAATGFLAALIVCVAVAFFVVLGLSIAICRLKNPGSGASEKAARSPPSKSKPSQRKPQSQSRKNNEVRPSPPQAPRLTPQSRDPPTYVQDYPQSNDVPYDHNYFRYGY